ncbi:AraC family transcriptional regulator [Paenibacillus spongiae]|uniref:AraC family transcriptional regulator n=1 Tax=Paenibacillus spongiae TaxID=2909671 RepID=A0ABY5S3U9_9BACL|nr:AraC family transcriptional regulator [Paenibacillus spongiae]UVI28349.1 AraC family transcriptional regulator [Paenibacillus spongiae]
MNSFELVATPPEFARMHLFYPILAGYDVSEPAFHFAREHFPAYELLLVEEGRGRFRQGSEWFDLGAGDCLLHDMRFPHAYSAHPEEPFRTYYVVFEGLDTETLWRRFTNAPMVLLEADRGSGGSDVVFRQLTAIIELMREGGDEIMFSSRLYELLVRTLSLAAHIGGAVVKPQSMEAAREFIDARYLGIHGIREAAEHVNLSLYHFIRQFKTCYGSTPKEYLLQKRVHHAKRLLLLTDDSVSDIAERSGFPSYNAFLHSFLRIEQCSPTEYRKNWRRRRTPSS